MSALLTVKEVAQRLRISLSQTYQLIDEHRIEHHRIGAKGRRGTIRIEDEAVAAFLESTREDLAEN